MPAGDLTDKQRKFAQEYLIDLNATQAAIRAGYSEDTAYSIGWENLRKPEIEAAIQIEMDKRSQRTEITIDKVLKEIAKLGFSNMMDYITIDDNGMPALDFTALSEEQAAAITEITVDTRKVYNIDSDEETATIDKVKFKLADKGINLERLGKHLKLFTDKVEHSGGFNVTVPDTDAGTL